MRQGQGIIDITNMYLQIALPYGLVGATLLFGPFFAVIGALLLSTSHRENADADVAKGRAIVCAALVGWCVLVTTTSNVVARTEVRSARG